MKSCCTQKQIYLNSVRKEVKKMLISEKGKEGIFKFRFQRIFIEIKNTDLNDYYLNLLP